MNSEDLGKITYILMNSNLGMVKMCELLFKIAKLNTDIDWYSDETPKIVLTEEDSTEVKAVSVEEKFEPNRYF